MTSTNCANDWITIPCATNSNKPTLNENGSICVDRICGMALNTVTGATLPSIPVTSFSKPFNIRVHTDDVEGTAEDANRGFCFDFVQQPCTTLLK